MILKELLTTYWSQVTLVLLGIGYILKRLLDDRSKKVEINHSLYQKGKLDTVVRFFESYVKVTTMWKHFEIYKMMNVSGGAAMSARDIDRIIFPPLNELNSIRYESKIYFDDENYKIFANLTDSMYQIHAALQKNYFDFNPERTKNEKVDDFTSMRDSILAINEAYIKELCIVIRNSFNGK